MTDVDDRLARVLHDAAPEPPHEFDPRAVRASAARHRQRRHLTAPALAAAAVVAVAVGVLLAAHQPATQQEHHHQQHPQRFVVPPPPAGFTANEFRMAGPAELALAVGPVPLPRATCSPRQITATAATRRTEGGVLGVVRLTGAVVAHRDGSALRCTLPIRRGPSALLTADGRVLNVPVSPGDRTTPPSNLRPDLPLTNGDAVWGFAWLGSYCSARAGAVEIPLRHAATGSLRIPLRGPQPSCDPATPASRLIDGIAGAPGQPVQPPRPQYSTLRLTGRIEPGTTSQRLAPINLTLRTTSTAAITLDPCPTYAGRDDATAHSGGFRDPIRSGYLPCTGHALVMRPGHPLHFTIPASSLIQTLGTGAIPGSTVHVRLGIAGVALLTLKTLAHR